jgi:hypothetical protein
MAQQLPDREGLPTVREAKLFPAVPIEVQVTEGQGRRHQGFREGREIEEH